MKPAAVLVGLLCAVLAPGTFGATVPAKKKMTTTKTISAQKTVTVKKSAPVRKTAQAPSPASAKVAAPKTIKPAPTPAPAAADASRDDRELVKMPSQARLAMRAEMRDRMSALDAVLQRLNAGQVVEAGQIAQLRLGVAAWWNHTKLPANAQPEQYMPPEMQNLALDGYKAASDFATVALTGDQHTATAMLPQLTGSCAQCHQAYRIR